jgi:hypothetical protein
MSKIVLADRYNTHDIIKEEREQWVTTILILLGVPEEEIYEGNQEQLVLHGIEVWDHLNNGDVEILQNKILVGKWYNPTLIPKYDKDNTIYYEIHLDYDSILENEFHSPGDKHE